MKKRIIMLACVLAFLVGCLVVSSSAATQSEYCEACKQTVTWETMPTGGVTISSGHKHYYATADGNYAQIIAQTTGNICIDLNGKQLVFPNGRAFLAYQATAATLSIQDSVGGATVTSYTYLSGENGYTSNTNNGSGGVMWSAANCIMNVYGGTYNLEKKTATSRTGNGGIAYVANGGTLNIYDCTMNGGEMGNATTKRGGTIDVQGGGILNIYGGTFTAGSGANYGNCINLQGTACKVTLSGAAQVDDIYMEPNTVNPAMVTVSGDFTGTANLSYGSDVSLRQGLTVGACATNDWTGTISCSDEAYPYAVPADGKLMLSAYPAGTEAVAGGELYNSLQDAVNAASEGALLEMVQSTADNISVNKNICLQLNGCSLTGTVTVAEGKTLYGMDSATDDFTVADGQYGKITKLVGNAAGVTLDKEVSQHNYIAVTEDSGVSFHCVSLDVYAMTLRNSAKDGTPGLYYKSHFKADELAAPLLESFGIALNVKEAPTAENMGNGSHYSTFTGFESGPDGNLGNATSTLLKGILRTTNSDAKNESNMNVSVYGRAYAKTADGQYLFGECVSRSLKEQLEGIDKIVGDLSSAQIKTVTGIYYRYKSVLETVGLTNIHEAWENEETGTLKILVLGNSHGLDATNLLPEVFYQERVAGNHDQDVLIAALYYGGCRVSQHHTFLQNNQQEYTYHKNYATTSGESWVVKNATCLDALQDEQWDIILMQQMNTNAGKESDYKASDWKFVADYLLNNQDLKPTLGFHMTWANPDDYDLFLNDDAPYNIRYISTYSDPTSWRTNHENLFNTGNGKYEMEVMYDEIMRLTQKYIVDATDWLGKDYFADRYIMNSATPIQYAQKVLGREQLNIYRDYTHVSDYGRLIVAYQWYAQLRGLEEITEVNVSTIPANLRHKNSKYPTDPTVTGASTVDAQMKADLIKSVNWALKNPWNLPTE